MLSCCASFIGERCVSLSVFRVMFFVQAQHNTRMLQTYALIDGRVKTLGYIMKVFAKVCSSFSSIQFKNFITRHM